VKRLRVRLKASGPEELAATFGRRLRMDGLDIPSKEPLEPGLELSVTLLYRNGQLALEGTGRVDACMSRARGGHTLRLAVRWSPFSMHALGRILPRTGEELVADLQGLPTPVDSTADVLRLPSDLLSADSLQHIPDVWQQPDTPPQGSEATQDELPPEMSTPALPADALESGEVTPLARIELVRPRRVPEIEPVGPVASLGAVRPGTRPGEAQGRLVLGVDFGTREIRAACMTGDETQVVPTRRGMSALPSVVHIDESGKTIVGEPALRRMARAPSFGMRDPRRLLAFAFDPGSLEEEAALIGQTLRASEDGETRIGPHEVLPEELVALLFKEVREASNLVMPDRINRAVLTAPTWSGPRLRSAIVRAGEAGGFHVERVVGEAAACALAYAVSGGRGRALVVSMGAGVLDVAVVRMEEGAVQVLAAGGSARLGGAEFDRALRPVIEDVVHQATDRRLDASVGFRLDACAQELKERLALHPRARGAIEIAVPGGASELSVEVELDRQRAEFLWTPLVEEASSVVRGTLEAGGGEVDSLLLAGGGLGIAPLRQAIRALVPGVEPVELDFDAAANGAAVVGARIARELAPGLNERLQEAVWLGAEGKRRWNLFPQRSVPPGRRSMELPVDRATKLALVQGDGEGRDWIGGLEMPPEAHGVAELVVQLTESLTLEASIDGTPVAVSSAPSGEAWFEALEVETPVSEQRGSWLDWFRRR